MPRISIITGVCLCLSLLFSCGKKEEPQPPLVTKLLSTGTLLSLDDFLPELESSHSIEFNDEMGYYLSLGEKEWSRSLSVDPVSIPAQSCGFGIDAYPFEADDFSGWLVEKNEEIVLEGIPDNLSWGQCPSIFKMTVSLGDDVPYRKVTLTDLIITFPSPFTARTEDAGYGIPQLEVTADGAVVTFRLDAMGINDLLVDKDGRRCCSIPIRLFALVTARPEDALISGAENAGKISLRYRFDFDRIDFTFCKLDFPGLSFPADELVWDAVRLPSFLCGEGTDLTLTHFRVFFDYKNDIPLVPGINGTLSACGGQVPISSDGQSVHLFLSAYQASNYQEGYFNEHVPALGTLIKSPFPGGTVQPSLVLQPLSETSDFVVPGQEYRMSVRVNLQLPLAFDGQIQLGSLSTPPLRMEGVSLGARAHYVHRINQTVGSNLPLDCRVTPVFTLEGEQPVYLEEFVLDKFNRKFEVSHEFAPATDQWMATLYYIVTPLRGWNEPIRKYCRMDVMESIFSGNLRAAE
jgi:hypothetical protein